MDAFSSPDLVGSDVETRIDPSFLSRGELDRLLQTYELRATEVTTPSDFLNLGELYLEQGRITGDLGRYRQAQTAFETAAGLSPQDPSPVMGLARTSLAMHEFSGAIEGARRVLADIPTRLDALAVLADAQMAIGDTAAAALAIDSLRAGAGDIAPVLVRRSQLAWLEGQVAESVSLAMEALPLDDPNFKRIAWYEAFASQMAHQSGEWEKAAMMAEAALRHDPESISALAASARAAVVADDLEQAADLLEKATALVPNPELAGELGDLYMALGRGAEAQDQFDLVDVIGLLAEAEDVYDRAVSRFYADHDLQTERALNLAETELKSRQDPLAFDTHAWALYRAGRFEEARSQVDRALVGGFRDAEVLYHDGLIALAQGETDHATKRLQEALVLNRHFDLRGGAEAERVLAELGG